MCRKNNLRILVKMKVNQIDSNSERLIMLLQDYNNYFKKQYTTKIFLTSKIYHHLIKNMLK